MSTLRARGGACKAAGSMTRGQSSCRSLNDRSTLERKFVSERVFALRIDKLTRAEGGMPAAAVAITSRLPASLSAGFRIETASIAALNDSAVAVVVGMGPPPSVQMPSLLIQGVAAKQ